MIFSYTKMINPKFIFYLVPDFITAAKHAGNIRTHLDMIFSHLFLMKHSIKCNNTENIFRSNIKYLCCFSNYFVGNKTILFLPDIKCCHYSRFLFRILFYLLFDSFNIFFGKFKFHKLILEPLYLSASPIIGSILPIIATTSEIICPTSNRGKTCILLNDGERILHFHG